MKVRLKRVKKLPKTRESVFQFHEGPIKTTTADSVVFRALQFQFHEGPIKTREKTKRKQYIKGFNSMKVRLKRN